jgi:hypothetical protein
MLRSLPCCPSLLPTVKNHHRYFDVLITKVSKLNTVENWKTRDSKYINTLSIVPSRVEDLRFLVYLVRTRLASLKKDFENYENDIISSSIFDGVHDSHLFHKYYSDSLTKFRKFVNSRRTSKNRRYTLYASGIKHFRLYTKKN